MVRPPEPRRGSNSGRYCRDTYMPTRAAITRHPHLQQGCGSSSASEASVTPFEPAAPPAAASAAGGGLNRRAAGGFPCPHCSALTPDYESLQMHVFTACPRAPGTAGGSGPQPPPAASASVRGTAPRGAGPAGGGAQAPARGAPAVPVPSAPGRGVGGASATGSRASFGGASSRR